MVRAATLPAPARPVAVDVSTGRSQPLSGGLARTDPPASDVSLSPGPSGVVYAVEPDLCPRCNGPGGAWAIYRVAGGVTTALVLQSDRLVEPGVYAGGGEGLAWVP